MKHKLQTMLKNKLQWILLLVALLGVSQGMWAGRTFVANEYFYLYNATGYVDQNGTSMGSNAWILSTGCGWLYVWNGSGSHSYKFELISGTAGSSTAVYGAKVTNAGTYDNFIITRNSSSSTGPWDNKWNQSGDLSFSGTKNYIKKTTAATTVTLDYYARTPSSCTILLGGSHSGSGTSADPYIVEPGESLTFTISATHADPGMTGVRASVNTKASKENYASGSSVTVSKTASASSSADETWVGYAWAYKSSTSYTSSSYATSSNTIYTRTAGGCTPPTMAIAATSADVNSITFNVKSTDAFDCDIDSWGVKAWTSSSCEGAAAFTQEGTGELTTTNQSVTVSGLSANTTYYFKSYAVTPSEERRSSTITKTTLIDPPSTASSSVTSSTTATLTAEAYSTGGGATTTLTAAGFIYSQTKSYIDSNTEASATIANSSVNTVGATYSTEITNLEPNKTYYYKPRIYYSVTNNQSSFKGYGSTTYSFKTNNVFGAVSINNNGVSSVCLGSGTVTWNASASSGNPTSWTVSSSNTNVATATINSSGVITITPKAAGSTTITATAKRTGYDDKTSDGVTITVNAAPTIILTGVGGKSASATYPWDYMTITATTTPADLVVNWTKLYSGSGSEPVNSVTKSASPSHTYKIKSAITSNPNSDKYTIKANGTSLGCAAIEAVYDIYINNPDGEICD